MQLNLEFMTKVGNCKMQMTKIMEDLSVSYISALCAYSGITYDTIRHDEDSTDGILKKEIKLENNQRYQAQLRVQLKSTYSSFQYKEDDNKITYRLRAKNYNDLCAHSTTPIILCLLILPSDENEWIKWSEKELLLRGRMYWKSLSHEPESTNKDSISISIDKTNVVNNSTLCEILHRIAREELG